jgi:hypothetical protein
MGVSRSETLGIHNVANKQPAFSAHILWSLDIEIQYIVFYSFTGLANLDSNLWTNMLSGETELAKVRKKSEAPLGSK